MPLLQPKLVEDDTRYAHAELVQLRREMLLFAAPCREARPSGMDAGR